MEIRRFCPGDEEVLSGLIRRTLLEVNAADCPAEEIEFLYNKYTPAGVLALAGQGHTYVLQESEELLGCGTLLPGEKGVCEIMAAFLKPEAIGRGLGKALFGALESDPLFTKAERVWLTSSVTALRFYEKLGYRYCCGWRGRNADGLIEMEKRPGQL